MIIVGTDTTGYAQSSPMLMSPTIGMVRKSLGNVNRNEILKIFVADLMTESFFGVPKTNKRNVKKCLRDFPHRAMRM